MAALAPVESVQALLSAIEKSSLLSAEALAKARETAAALNDSRAIARALIKDGTLTRWQADQLLHGFHRLIVGKYKLLDQIETSPTGRIYLAEHVQMGRRHSLKVLAKRLATNPEAVARFLKSAQNACGLDHKNISHVYDVSQDRLGHYIVMEYVEGQSLEQLVEKSGPLQLEQALVYIAQVADGLAYAHAHGVVHGDLKPANLLRDSNGVIKIQEIGQDSAGARPQTDEADKDIETAALAAVIFQAPEMRGDGEAADIACDVYSLGSVLSFLLTGKAAKNAATAAANLQAKKAIPEAVVALCGSLMADSPTDRPKSLAAVLNIIQSIWMQIAESNKSASTENAVPAAKKQRDEKVADDEIVAAPPVAASIAASMPVIAISEQAPPVIPPPKAELVIQTSGKSNKRPANSGAIHSPSAARWSISNLANRFPRLVLAGAIGGAFVFVFGIGALVALLVAANRAAKPVVKVKNVQAQPAERAAAPMPAVNENIQSITANANPEIAVATALPTGATAPSPAEPLAAAPSAAATAEPKPADPKTEATDAPVAVVAAVPAKPPEPISAPAKKANSDPFQGFPKAITLPPMPEPDWPASLKPVSLGPCEADEDTPITIALIGGDTAIRATRQRFELQPREKSNREWDIQLTGNGESAAIAALSVKGGQLLFQWTEEAAKQSVVARNLMNCALVLGKSKQTVALRTPQKGLPLVIDIEKPSAAVKWTVNSVPLAKQVFLEVTRTEGFPKLRQDPKGPTNVGDTVTIGTGPAEKSTPLLFKLNTSSGAATIDVRAQPMVKVEGWNDARPYRRNDFLAMQVQYEQNLMRLRGEMRKAKDSRPRLEPEKEAREATIMRLANEETSLNTVLDQLRFVVEFASMTEGVAKVHFRVYFLVGETKVDLLRTEEAE